MFARSKAYALKKLFSKNRVLLSGDECEEFLKEGKKSRFDLYRIPFNGGKWIVFCKAESFMLLQPDSQLYVIPSEGGRARRWASTRCLSRASVRIRMRAATRPATRREARLLSTTKNRQAPAAGLLIDEKFTRAVTSGIIQEVKPGKNTFDIVVEKPGADAAAPPAPIDTHLG